MTTTGKIKDIARNMAGETVLTLKIDVGAELVEELQGADLDIDISKHRKKRSLNANAYYHLLCGKMAKRLGTSMTEVCNQMISDYGEMDKDMGAIILRDDINWKKIEGLHLRPTGRTQTMADGKNYACYWVMRGSHTYNTKEMAHLIDGVISECKELGIETLTPAQLATLINAWGNVAQKFD